MPPAAHLCLSIDWLDKERIVRPSMPVAQGPSSSDYQVKIVINWAKYHRHDAYASYSGVAILAAVHVAYGHVSRNRCSRPVDEPELAGKWFISASTIWLSQLT